MADDPVPLSGLPDWMLPVSKVPFSSMAGIFNDAPDWSQLRETDPTAGLALGANVAPSDHERRTLDAIRRGVGRIADDPISGSAYVASKIPGMLYNAYTNADAPDGTVLASTATPGKGPGALLGEAEAAAAARPGITAYHGSPYDFDKFDPRFIGTGEGTQLQGYGFNFSNNEKLADTFRSAYGKKDTEGHMYKVNLDVKPDDLIQWDQPFSAQSEKVKTALRKLVPTMNEDAAYSVKGELRNFVQTPEGAKRLAELGVKGVEYPRWDIQGDANTRNYAIFDDKLIDILKKYGIAGLAMIPALQGTSSGSVPLSTLPMQQQ